MKLYDLNLLTEIDTDEEKTASTVIGGLGNPDIGIDDCGNTVPIYFICVKYPCCLGPKRTPMEALQL